MREEKEDKKKEKRWDFGSRNRRRRKEFMVKENFKNIKIKEKKKDEKEIKRGVGGKVDKSIYRIGILPI